MREILLLNSLKRVALEKLTVAQVVTNFDQQSFFVLRANIKQR
jgi:hypothetical protein